MNSKKLLERHLLPCGPMSVSVEGVCRRRLRDSMDALLDRLTKETHPEGVDVDLLDLEERVEIPEIDEPEETDMEKKDRMVSEGKLKVDVQKEVDKYKDEVNPTEEEPKETEEDKKKRLIKEGKFNNEVKHAVKKHAEKLQGNSRMLQDKSGKIQKR